MYDVESADTLKDVESLDSSRKVEIVDTKYVEGVDRKICNYKDNRDWQSGTSIDRSTITHQKRELSMTIRKWVWWLARSNGQVDISKACVPCFGCPR